MEMSLNSSLNQTDEIQFQQSIKQERQEPPQNMFSRSTPDLIAAGAGTNFEQHGIALRTTFNDSFDGGNSRFGTMSSHTLKTRGTKFTVVYA